MLIEYDETMDLLTEGAENSLRLSGGKDKSSVANFFTTKPQGIIIQDTWNNFAFPIRPRPHIDTKKFELNVIFQRYKELYSASHSHLMLPWHYVVEMIGVDYFVFNTRPITMRYPLKTKEVISRRDKIEHVDFNLMTESFLNDNIFDVSEAIHVCIVGDTNFDVYPRNCYKMIGSFCMRPTFHYFKIPDTIYTRTFPLNIGRKFNTEYLMKFVKR